MLGPAAAADAPLLLPLLHDPERGVRSDGAHALGRIGVRTPEIEQALRKAALSDPAPDVRVHAAASLFGIHVPDAGVTFSEILPGLPEDERESAVRVAPRLDPSGSIHSATPPQPNAAEPRVESRESRVESNSPARRTPRVRVSWPRRGRACSLAMARSSWSMTSPAAGWSAKSPCRRWTRLGRRCPSTASARSRSCRRWYAASRPREAERTTCRRYRRRPLRASCYAMASWSASKNRAAQGLAARTRAGSTVAKILNE